MARPTNSCLRKPETEPIDFVPAQTVRQRQQDDDSYSRIHQRVFLARAPSIKKISAITYCSSTAVVVQGTNNSNAPIAANRLLVL